MILHISKCTEMEHFKKILIKSSISRQNCLPDNGSMGEDSALLASLQVALIDLKATGIGKRDMAKQCCGTDFPRYQAFV